MEAMQMLCKGQVEAIDKGDVQPDRIRVSTFGIAQATGIEKVSCLKLFCDATRYRGAAKEVGLAKFLLLSKRNYQIKKRYNWR